MYITPVTIQALTCLENIPNDPVINAVNKHIRLTIVHDEAEFCIPNRKLFFSIKIIYN